MRSQRKGGLSAITKVKVLSPVIANIAQGQGLHLLEASTAARVRGECASGVPGSKSMAGNPISHIGTWESHIVPKGSFQQAEEARRKYGDMVVGLTQERCTPDETIDKIAAYVRSYCDMRRDIYSFGMESNLFQTVMVKNLERRIENTCPDTYVDIKEIKNTTNKRARTRDESGKHPKRGYKIYTHGLLLLGYLLATS